MGNLCACLSPKPVNKKNNQKKKKPSLSKPAPVQQPLSNSTNRWTKIRSSRNSNNFVDDHAIAAAFLFQQQHNGGGGGGSLPFDRSSSLRIPIIPCGSKKQCLPRSSSTRSRSVTDPLIQPHQLINQDVTLDDLESKHFVLVHGGGFGAWCWYKSIALLEESGFKVTAIDLTGSGIHLFDTNGITTLSQYVKPLTDFLEKLTEGEKVIIVGHDFGGACISYAMELFPFKVSKAIFIAATMLTSGQSTLDMLSRKEGSNKMMLQAQVFLYANGKNNPPTAIDFDKSMLRDLLFNQCQAKDVALALVSMRPVPFTPVLEKLRLSDANFGSIRRFYIETPDDNAIPITVQESMINSSPPEQVFRLKGADHSPFFSKPQALHKVLIEISKLHSTNGDG